MHIPEIVSIHAEETAFLWQSRDVATKAPHYNFAQLFEVDDRVSAHLAGLAIAGNAAWPLVDEVWPMSNPGDIFAFASQAVALSDEAKFDEVCAIVLENPELARGLISALSWIEPEKAQPWLERLWDGAMSEKKCWALAAASAHRNAPASMIEAAIKAEHAGLRARALRAIGEMGTINLSHVVALNYKSPDPACQFWAAWSGALVDESKAGEALTAIASNSEHPYKQRAFLAAILTMDANEARTWCDSMFSTNPRLAIQGRGLTGDPVVVPVLLESAKTAELSRISGEAISMITGVDLEYLDLTVDAPEKADEDSTDDPIEEDHDDNLPWPNIALLSGWWDSNKANYETGKCYVAGQPLTKEGMEAVLRNGQQRQRAHAAIRLKCLQRAIPLFNVKAHASRQRALILSGQV